MKTRHYLILFITSLCVSAVVSIFQSAPGYMDAEYYFAGGLRLAAGEGFSEPFLWNYLDAPAGIPHPSHLYWMPLASLVASLGMSVGGNGAFWAARLPFLLIASGVAPLTAWLSYRIVCKKEVAILSGLLAAFAGFYLPYYPTTDTFGLYMLFGLLFMTGAGVLLDARSSNRRILVISGCLGVLAGLMHLSRADGILWLGLVFLVLLYRFGQQWKSQRTVTMDIQGHRKSSPWGFSWLGALALVLGGYLLVMAPWYIRNLTLFGFPFSPGASHALWLTNYDEMFRLNPQDLNFESWINSGPGGILGSRLEALKMNIQTAVIVQGGIFLVPLILVGWWQLRKNAVLRIATLGWMATFLIMTLVFPFAGYRGGFLHSGAAVQPLIWVLAPIGLEVFIRWGSRVRRWNVRQAWRFLAVGTASLAILMSGMVVARKVIGSTPEVTTWNQGYARQVRLGEALDEMNISHDSTLLVNNPPGFYVATGRASIVIPYGDERTILQAAERYEADYLLLDENHVEDLDPLFEQPATSETLQFVTTVEGTNIFRVVE